MGEEAGRPKLTAIDDRIYGEMPEDGLIARVYGDPDLAQLFAVAGTALQSFTNPLAVAERISPIVEFVRTCEQDGFDSYAELQDHARALLTAIGESKP